VSKALIVIDVQNDFCPGGNLAVADGDAVVSPINALMADFGAVVLTQDWHPRIIVYRAQRARRFTKTST